MVRGASVGAGLFVLPYVQPYLSMIESDPARLIANFHTLFNLALALAFLPLVGPVAALTQRILPDQKADDDPSQPRYLDPDAVQTPSSHLQQPLARLCIWVTR